MRRITILTNARAADQRSMTAYGDKLLEAARQTDANVRELRGVSAFARLRSRGRLGKLARNLDRFALSPVRMAAHRTDLVHVADPGNVVYLPFIRHRASICTVHDMIPYLVRAGRLEGGHVTALGSSLMDRILWQLERVDRIVCVSHATKRDLLEFVDIDPDRVTVIHNTLFQPMQPASAEACADLRRRLGLPQNAPVVLHVGRNFYKNRPMVLDVFAQVRRERPDARLVLVGDLEPTLAAQVTRLGIEDVVNVLTYITPVDMSALYTTASALLFPSLYEGFGLPVTEAQACGTKVICSDRGALSEVGGYQTKQNRADDLESFKKDVEAVLDLPPERYKAITEKGKTNRSWFCEHKKIYEQLLKERAVNAYNRET